MAWASGHMVAPFTVTQPVEGMDLGWGWGEVSRVVFRFQMSSLYPGGNVLWAGGNRGLGIRQRWGWINIPIPLPIYLSLSESKSWRPLTPIELAGILQAAREERLQEKGTGWSVVDGQVRKDHWIWKHGSYVWPWQEGFQWNCGDKHGLRRFMRKREMRENGRAKQILQSLALKSSKKWECFLEGDVRSMEGVWVCVSLFKTWGSGTCLHAMGVIP